MLLCECCSLWTRTKTRKHLPSNHCIGFDLWIALLHHMCLTRLKAISQTSQVIQHEYFCYSDSQFKILAKLPLVFLLRAAWIDFLRVFTLFYVALQWRVLCLSLWIVCVCTSPLACCDRTVVNGSFFLSLLILIYSALSFLLCIKHAT